MAFLSGCGEIIFPVLLVLGLGTRFAALGLVHDMHRRAYRAGRLAYPYHVGGHGARHHGLGPVGCRSTMGSVGCRIAYQ